jgi:hypothetical protein
MQVAVLVVKSLLVALLFLAVLEVAVATQQRLLMAVQGLQTQAVEVQALTLLMTLLNTMVVLVALAW